MVSENSEMFEGVQGEGVDGSINCRVNLTVNSEHELGGTTKNLVYRGQARFSKDIRPGRTTRNICPSNVCQTKRRRRRRRRRRKSISVN
jgi:hypothetical protein